MSATTADAMGIRSEDRHFYLWMAIGFLVVAFGGFVPTYWSKIAAGSFHGPAIIHVHGFFLFGWVCFYLVQTSLVTAGRTMDHRNWGLAGIALFSFVLCSILAGQMGILKAADARGVWGMPRADSRRSPCARGPSWPDSLPWPSPIRAGRKSTSAGWWCS